jgi:hypothetical protein
VNAIAANVLASCKSVITDSLPDSVTFKVKDGSTVLGPIPCSVIELLSQPSEAMAGTRTTVEEEFELVMAAGITVQPFWRPFITFAGAATSLEYFVMDTGAPVSDEVATVVRVKRVK